MLENEKFARLIRSCEGSLNASSVYSDGGIDYEHGMWADDSCTCGVPRHYTSPEGEVFWDLWEYNSRREEG